MNIDNDELFNINNTEQINDAYNFIDISIQQRTTKKAWTVISNLQYPDEKKKEIIQKAKKKFSCSGTIDENGNIRFSGNHKNEIGEFICGILNIKIEKIRIH